jgi:uracil phosphoribosyltransferase
VDEKTKMSTAIVERSCIKRQNGLMRDLNQQSHEIKENMARIQARMIQENYSEKEKHKDEIRLRNFRSDLARTEMIRSMQYQAISDVSRMKI